MSRHLAHVGAQYPANTQQLLQVHIVPGKDVSTMANGKGCDDGIYLDMGVKGLGTGDSMAAHVAASAVSALATFT